MFKRRRNELADEVARLRIQQADQAAEFATQLRAINAQVSATALAVVFVAVLLYRATR